MFRVRTTEIFSAIKMRAFKPKKEFLRALILHYYLAKWTPAHTHRLLAHDYGAHAPSDFTCRKWFKQFRTSDLSLANKKRGKPLKKFEIADLEQLLDEDPCQTQQQY